MPTWRPEDGGRRRVVGLALAAAICAALAYVDARLPSDDSIIATVVLAPLVCALLGTARDVAAVGVVATALALLSGVWDDSFERAAYYLRAGVVGVGSLVAYLAAALRETVVRDRARFAVLSGVAGVTDGSRTLDETAARLHDLIVPTIADASVLDVVRRGEVRRLAARVRDSPDLEERLSARTPSLPDVPGSSGAVASGDVHVVGSVDDAFVQRIAHDAEDLALLRELQMRSLVVVPLVARGRTLGALALATTAQSRRSFADDDVDFVKVLSGRVALALDNAGLFSELETIEAQLSAALDGLAEAVTIQHTEGALVYANDAAARMLGFASAQELLSTPVQRVIAGFESFHEDGTPLRVEDLPGRRLLAGQDAPPLIVRAVNRTTGDERWRVTKSTPVRDRDGRVQLVVNVIDDITDVKRAELAQRLLARAGAALSASLDDKRMLQDVAQLAVPELADWCTIGLPDGRGLIRTVAVAHVDPGRVAFARRVAETYPTREDDPTGVARVLREGASQVVNDISDAMIDAAARDPAHAAMLKEIGMRAALAVPMVAGGRVIGTLSLVQAESGRTFAPADVELAEELARRAGTAVENARLYVERSRIARTLQQGLLPEALPDMPGWSAQTLYRPAGSENWVGGDFYDVVAVPGGWLLIVGDVAGHGAEAAALTALARHTLRSVARLLPDPLEAVATLNAELAARDVLSLVTVAAALLSERDGRAVAEVVCAGHPRPLLRHAAGIRPVGRFGPILGAYADERWDRETVALAPGDALVLYTDGVLDTVGEARERFGEARLRAALDGATDPDDAIARIDAALQRFEVGEQADDTAVLAVQRIGVPDAAHAAIGAAGGAAR